MIKKIGILGGSFDPIHNGHIALAIYAKQALALDELLLLPVGVPCHREPLIASFHHRLEMIKLALVDHNLSAINESKLDAPRTDGLKNATIHILKNFRARDKTSSLIWLLGADSFQHFDSWLGWQEIPTLAHIVVCERPNFSLELSAMSTAISDCWNKYSHDSLKIHCNTSGVISTMPFPALDCSSSSIRQHLRAKKRLSTTAKQLYLSSSVYRYIYRYNLYL